VEGVKGVVMYHSDIVRIVHCKLSAADLAKFFVKKLIP